jgi:hypothetical protein
MTTSSDSPSWITVAHDTFEALFGISKFNQTVPLVISGVAIGVSLVNRNFPKCLGHLGGATIVALVSVVIIAFSGIPCKQFTTAFLWYTIGYVSFCMQSSTKLDENSLIGIVLSFIVLIFVDVVTFLGGSCQSLGAGLYIGLMLFGVVGGIGGYYATYSLDEGALYDFSGCSCDDCDSKCAIGSKTQTVMAKRLAA